MLLAEAELGWRSHNKRSAHEAAELQVLALKNFACAPTEHGQAPYTRLFRACEKLSESQLSRLLDTKLMIVVTKFKWDTYVRRRVLHRLYKYLGHFVVAQVALLTSTQTTERV